MRRLVVGDIHGGYKALMQCFVRCKFNVDKDQLITLGDYCDGWSEVPQVLDTLDDIREATYRKDNEYIPLLGNHDDWAMEWLRSGNAQHIWLSQGGKATYDAMKSWFEETPQDKHRFLEFLMKCHYYYLDDDNNAFMHAGYTSEKGCGHEKHRQQYIWDRTLWERIALPGNSAAGEMPKRLRPHKEIFIGHTSTMFWNEDKPMNACNVWNLDTGGGWHGKLTIMDVDTKEYWQSDLVKDLYPDEKGR